jgi:hypothetical protein
MKKSNKFVAHITIAMRITILQLTLCAIFATTLQAKETKGQAILQKTFSISAQNLDLQKIISLVHRQTKVKFDFSANAINAERVVSYYVAKDKKILDFLDELNHMISVINW